MAKITNGAELKQRDHKTIDLMAYFVGIVGNFAVLPQLVKSWQGPTPGVAILTWILFILFGVVWLIYAIVHKQKPLIFAQIVGIGFNLAVVVGYLVNNI